MPEHPQVKQFSPIALGDILQSFAGWATQISQLRHFVIDTLLPPSTNSATRSKTKEAYAEGCRVFLQDFDAWIGEIETASVRGVQADSDIPSTPISLLNAFRLRWSSRLNSMTALQELSSEPAQLIDAILASYETAPSSADQRHLLNLFVCTAAPVWLSLRSWLVDGMPLPSSFLDIDEVNHSLDGDERPLDPELFIKRDRDVMWTDEDFWESGYIADPGNGWPAWMGETMTKVLESGKARGLLRGLVGEVWHVDGWRTLQEICSDGSRAETVVDIPKAIEDTLGPLCQITIFQLRRALNEECGLDQHLEAIEGVMFGRAYATVERFFAVLYSQVRLFPSRRDRLTSQIKEDRRWHDMQSLTAGLRDAIDQAGEFWLNPSALRISPGRRKIKDQRDVLGALGELRVSYTVPFPLSVLFTSNSLELRSRVFGFLCQVDYTRRAIVDGRAFHGTSHWALDQRLGWFVK